MGMFEYEWCCDMFSIPSVVQQPALCRDFPGFCAFGCSVCGGGGGGGWSEQSSVGPDWALTLKSISVQTNLTNPQSYTTRVLHSLKTGNYCTIVHITDWYAEHYNGHAFTVISGVDSRAEERESTKVNMGRGALSEQVQVVNWRWIILVTDKKKTDYLLHKTSLVSHSPQVADLF